MFWQKIGNSVSDRLFRDSVCDSVIAENQCLYTPLLTNIPIPINPKPDSTTPLLPNIPIPINPKPNSNIRLLPNIPILAWARWLVWEVTMIHKCTQSNETNTHVADNPSRRSQDNTFPYNTGRCLDCTGHSSYSGTSTYSPCQTCS